MINFIQEDVPQGRNLSTGNAAQKALIASGSDPFSSEGKFIREVLQNSCDAAKSKTEDVWVSFRAVKLDPNREADWNQQLGITNYLKERIKEAVPRFPEENRLGSVLFIEDYATTGLNYTGEEHVEDTKFYRFFFGSGDNEDQGGTGGSFGYGKGVYTENSSIRTIVAYSCSEENGVAKKRIFGITRTKKYVFNSQKYSGYIYHGIPTEDAKGVKKSEPIEGTDADRLAELLGFSVRSDNETGTSIAVIGLESDPDEFMDAIKKETEIYWWKKIIDRQLDVEFIFTDGRTTKASPRENSMLTPFITCYETATSKREKPDSEKAVYREPKLNATGEFSETPGKLALLELQHGTEEAPDTASQLINSVALFRSSGMVIEYRKPSGISDIGKYVAGVFLASESLNELLRSSEPANHWGWNQSSGRIAELGAYKDLGMTIEGAKNLIKSINTRIDGKFNEFRDKLGETNQVSQASFRSLDKLMSELLGTGTGKGGGGSVNRGISIINKSSTPIPGKNPLMEQYECSVLITLDEDAEEDVKELVVRHYIEIKGDDAANSIIDRLESEVLETSASSSGTDPKTGSPIYAITKEGCSFRFLTQLTSPRFHRETETIVKGASS